MPFLRALDSESVDLVCIDPPFGKKQTFEGKLKQKLSDEERRVERELMGSWGVVDKDTAYDMGIEYPDQEGTTASFKDIWSFRKRVYGEWLENLKDICPGAYWLIEATRHTHTDGTAAYLAFMVERMLEVRRILKPSGSVYLHCDHEASAYLRQMMDAVFGHRNFRNEIVWRSVTSTGKGSQHRPKKWGNSVNSILFYAKSNACKVKPWRDLEPEEIVDHFPLEDERGRRYLDDTSHMFRSPSQGLRPNLCYEWRGFKAPHPSGWRLSRERLEEEYEKGSILITDDGKLERRLYHDDYKGFPVGNLWSDIEPVKGDEKTGYPTQKPQALAQRIIEASTEPGDLVLDCFAGCAYVPVAAQLTKRRWIACDMSPRAWTIVRRQFHKHPRLGIRTEGELPAGEGGQESAVEQRLTTAGRIIRVRGPLQLPKRTSDDSYAQGRIVPLRKVTYRQKPQETSDQIWEAFVDEWGTKCWYCGKEKGRHRQELHLDHIEPNNGDGSNDDCWNRALSCAVCNSNKSDTLTPEETIHRAKADGLIQTDALLDEVLSGFKTRREWARNRWELEVKPNKML